VVERIIELCGEVKLVNSEKRLPVFQDIEEQLCHEHTAQQGAIEILDETIRNIYIDIVTEQFLIGYLKDETNHTNWLKQQIDLIKSIGIQNYLSAQV
jgi:bacterioferritin